MRQEVEFNKKWYEKLINNTDEKDILISKISDLIRKGSESCIEIGLGTSPYFAKKLVGKFKRYIIIEKRAVKTDLPKEVRLINEDWEEVTIKEKADIIIASHVVYYFKDKKKALNKILNSLNSNGKAYFVVNGKSADYGPLKQFFAGLVNENYRFTYDELLRLLKNKRIREYTVPSMIRFESFEDLFETLRISFDMYPEEYNENKEKIMSYFKDNIKSERFIVDQKIIEVAK